MAALESGATMGDYPTRLKTLSLHAASRTVQTKGATKAALSLQKTRGLSGSVSGVRGGSNDEFVAGSDKEFLTRLLSEAHNFEGSKNHLLQISVMLQNDEGGVRVLEAAETSKLKRLFKVELSDEDAVIVVKIQNLSDQTVEFEQLFLDENGDPYSEDKRQFRLESYASAELGVIEEGMGKVSDLNKDESDT